jgi:hypothetical protein
MVAALTRTLVMEDGLGVSSGHAETQAFVQSWIKRFESPKPARSKQSRVGGSKKK